MNTNTLFGPLFHPTALILKASGAKFHMARCPSWFQQCQRL